MDRIKCTMQTHIGRTKHGIHSRKSRQRPLYSRNDPKDRRLGELIQRQDLDRPNFDVVIIGVPGNVTQTEPGAAKGPEM